MPEGKDAGGAILKVLKFNPRGLTITDVSRKIGNTRSSTAKHLEILKAEGKVETRLIGTAKVYTLAQRIPLSAFLCFTKNMILILDQYLSMVQANDQYIKLTGLSKQELIGRNLTEGTLPIVSTPEVLAIIRSTGNEQVIIDIRSLEDTDEHFYKMEVIPTTFESGESGLTVVLEDITDQKRHVKNMEFLAGTAMELVDLPLDTDIFRYIAERITELLPDKPRCWVTSYDEVKQQIFMRAIVGQVFREGAARLAGGHELVGMSFPLFDFFYRAPFFMSPSTMKNMREFHFRPFFDDEQISFYDICARQIPKEVGDAILQEFNIGKMYLTGLVWQDQLFGVVGICLSPDEVLENKQAIESFLRQASIAISRRMTEERLSRSDRRFKDLLSLADLPTAVIDREGRVMTVNPKFTELFGYMQDDIPTREKWFEKAFPDPEYRRETVSAWSPDHPGTLTVRCRNGEEKDVISRPVALSDGTQVVTFEVAAARR
jgi:PAS domain S-box-containing protein